MFKRIIEGNDRTLLDIKTHLMRRVQKQGLSLCPYELESTSLKKYECVNAKREKKMKHSKTSEPRHVS